MTEAATLVQLHDIDLMLAEARDREAAGRLKKLGFEVQNVVLLERARARLLAAIDRRWLNLYERALKRYGRGVAVVRERVCQGCFITLPTSLSAGSGVAFTVCESCGRILYWP